MAHQTSRPVARHTGPGTLFTQQGIYEESSTAKHELGERLCVGDRTFIYSNAGAAIPGGNLCEQATLGGATTTLQNTCAVTVAAVAGATKVYVNALSNAQTANTFADGYAAIWDATTAGTCFLYRIKSNSALATSGVTSYITLYDELHLALTTSDQVSLIANPYKAVVTATAAAGGGALGVAPVDISNGYYFWLQTYGPCAVYPEAAIDPDEDVVRSDATAGTVCKRASAAEGQRVGYSLHIGTAAESCIVFLTLRA